MRKRNKPLDDSWLFQDFESEEEKRKRRTQESDDADDFFGYDYTPPRRKKRRGTTGGVWKIIGLCVALVAVFGLTAALFTGLADSTLSDGPAEPEVLPTVSTTAPENTLPPIFQVSTPDPLPEPTLPLQTQPAEPEPQLPVQSGTNRYFRNTLSSDHQRIYDLLLECMMNHEAQSEPFLLSDYNELFGIMDAIYLDCAEIFWIDWHNLNGYYTCTYVQKDNGHELVVTPVYRYSQAEAQANQLLIDAVVDPVIAQYAGASDYDKVVGVHDFLIDYLIYDINYKGTDIFQNLRDGRSVCEGYARCTQYLLNKLGMEVIFVEGTGHGEAHSWNIVKVEGSYYQLDTTWDDPVMPDDDQQHFFDYCLIPSSVMLRDHVYEVSGQDVSGRYPDCTATDANYFVREGLMVYSYDPETLKTLLSDAILNYGKVYLRCSDQAVYDTLMQQLFQNNRIWDIVEQVAPNNHVKYYCYWQNDTCHTITMEFMDHVPQ